MHIVLCNQVIHRNTLQLCSIRQKLTQAVPRATKYFTNLQSTSGNEHFRVLCVEKQRHSFIISTDLVWKIFIKTVLVLKSDELI